MNQKDINASVDYLYTHGRKYAEAKGRRVQMEEYRKSLKAMLMKKAQADGKAKTSAAAEVEAYADPSYVEFLKGLAVAVEEEEALRSHLVQEIAPELDCCLRRPNRFRSPLLSPFERVLLTEMRQDPSSSILVTLTISMLEALLLMQAQLLPQARLWVSMVVLL
mgnify:CR=1 FL=1